MEIREQIVETSEKFLRDFESQDIGHYPVGILAAQILALPDLFTEEAELLARLIDKGWIPPEEAKNYVRLADDQELPGMPGFLDDLGQRTTKAAWWILQLPDANGNVWKKVEGGGK